MKKLMIVLAVYTADFALAQSLPHSPSRLTAAERAGLLELLQNWASIARVQESIFVASPVAEARMRGRAEAFEAAVNALTVYPSIP